MAKLILNEARAEQYLAEPSIESNEKYELGEELLKELRSNSYSKRVEEDVVGHIAKILEILDPIEVDENLVQVKMDDPNITMEEFIRLVEEKAHRRGKVYNWETATYGKIWYDEYVHDHKSFETKFPAIVLNDALTSEATLLCGPTVSPLNDSEIDFRISFEEFDDEDYTVIYDENSFSYKIISVNNLKMNFENYNKVNMPSFPSPEPEVSYSNDLDYFKDFGMNF
ncbi:hypothetical protein Tco_0908893 [Tanacetum coccineum]|uniref:Uncharacterized protein n=1 Tax=Tanacetum coccineum TaxID=301880 RepID=A0ABQ5CRS1_9ASTR